MKLLIALACLHAICCSAQTQQQQQHQFQVRQASTQLPGFTKLTSDEVRHLQNKGFGPTAPTPFRRNLEESEEEDEEDDDISLAQSQARRPIYQDDAYVQNIIPVQVRPQQQRPIQRKQQYVVQQQQVHNQQQQQKVYHQQQQQQQQYAKGEAPTKGKLEEEEEEEPDRLSLLLPQSKFDCTNKNTGYYADEDLGCEVFHYCQDNAKHSWICPEGFTFHQVHLICMPPGSDNICSKSSQFHFVNEYLYKPINLEEHQRKPNITLRYSDRYYPENYYDNNRYDDEEEGEVPQPYQGHQRRPIQVGFHPATQQQIVAVLRPQHHQQQKQSPTLRPDTTLGQVFRSPEEVNISLQQRRPQYVTQRYRDELGY